MNTVLDETVQAQPLRHIQVGILYNGLEKKIGADPQQPVRALLEKAIAAFGNLPNPHTLALYTKKGAELTNEKQTIREAGIKNGDELLLRPSAVKGGG